MKYLVHFSRLFVGVLFIISGFIKLNDPVGFAFKLEEYFSSAVLNLPIFEPYALGISIFVVIFEVLLGVFLLIGYKPKFTVYSLLAMIVFFTFLTFYSAYYNKVTDCGCFGDAVKLTPWESFTKDVVLLVFILILVKGLKFIKPLMKPIGLTVVSLLSFVLCLSFAYYVLMHLPAIDFRPYKIGANIIDNMIVPDDAPKAEIEYTWTFKVDGKEQKYITSGSYPNVENGEYVGVETKVVKEGYEPPIHDFSMEQDGEDYTEDLMAEPKLLMIVMFNLDRVERDGLSTLRAAVNKAETAGYKVVALTASGQAQQQSVNKTYGLNLDFYFCDETALKTIVRSNPGLLKVHSGTILQKVHWNDVDQLSF
jgi:uncharacterized membrane protein YphA (DoxX/SURF4 family)